MLTQELSISLRDSAALIFQPLGDSIICRLILALIFFGAKDLLTNNTLPIHSLVFLIPCLKTFLQEFILHGIK